MNPRRTALLLVATSIASMTFAVAQTSPQSDTTSPSAASSPHQRDATSSHAPEASTANGANPTSAATPHQQQATSASGNIRTSKAERKQAMKECVAREQADHSGMSMADAKKTCKDQSKVRSK